MTPEERAEFMRAEIIRVMCSVGSPRPIPSVAWFENQMREAIEDERRHQEELGTAVVHLSNISVREDCARIVEKAAAEIRGQHSGCRLPNGCATALDCAEARECLAEKRHRIALAPADAHSANQHERKTK